MSNLLFLTVEEVLRLHAYQIAEFGGDPGVRDMHLLESAVAMPQQGIAGNRVHPDLAAMAAAYLFHITRNHPFTDGNKRTGTHAALVFLELNGHAVEPEPEEAEALVVGVAAGTVTKEEVAAHFRRLLDRSGPHAAADSGE